jgi:putative membrane protein
MRDMDLRGYAYEHPRRVTAVLSVLGYALVVGAFAGILPLPGLTREQVLRFSDLIAVINTTALVSLLYGVYSIKQGQIRRHRVAMLTAFVLILVFLVVYLWKVGGGFEKEIVIEQGHFLGQYASVIRPLYLAMLAIHILLSALAVPVVLHAVVLGLTHPVSALPQTLHPRVGRLAVAAWSLSLFLGIVTYWLLNHVYAWVPR